MSQSLINTITSHFSYFPSLKVQKAVVRDGIAEVKNEKMPLDQLQDCYISILKVYLTDKTITALAKYTDEYGPIFADKTRLYFVKSEEILEIPILDTIIVACKVYFRESEGEKLGVEDYEEIVKMPGLLHSHHADEISFTFPLVLADDLNFDIVFNFLMDQSAPIDNRDRICLISEKGHFNAPGFLAQFSSIFTKIHRPDVIFQKIHLDNVDLDKFYSNIPVNFISLDANDFLNGAMKLLNFYRYYTNYMRFMAYFREDDWKIILVCFARPFWLVPQSKDKIRLFVLAPDQTLDFVVDDIIENFRL